MGPKKSIEVKLNNLPYVMPLMEIASGVWGPQDEFECDLS